MGISKTDGGPAQLSGERIRHHRQAVYMSPTDLGARVGLSGDSIRAYEAGRQTPPSDVLAKIVHALGCTFDDLHVPAASAVSH